MPRTKNVPDFPVATQDEVRCCTSCPLDDCHYTIPDSGCPLRVLLGKPLTYSDKPLTRYQREG